MHPNHILEHNIEGVVPEEIEAHFSLLPERYFINSTADEIELHLRMVNQLLTQIQQADSIGSLAPASACVSASDTSLCVSACPELLKADLSGKINRADNRPRKNRKLKPTRSEQSDSSAVRFERSLSDFI